MAKIELPANLPDEIWDGCEFTSIHATAVVVKLEDPLATASALPPDQYNSLINEFQRLILKETGSSRKHPSIAEVHLSGAQAKIYFYKPIEVEWNRQLDGPEPLSGSARRKVVDNCRESKQLLAYDALKLAIQINICWLSTDFNLQRVRSHLDPLLVGIGIHTGRAYLNKRADDTIRIEGSAIDLAEKVREFSMSGRYSHIMVSARTREYISRTVIGHSQLSQRIYFHDHVLEPQEMKGFLGSHLVSEVRFFHLIGVHLGERELPRFEALFSLSRSNTWAYNLLADHYGYIVKDWQKMYQIARRAHVAVPGDEKVLYDLATYFLKIERVTLAIKFSHEALKINPSLDIAWELLARIANMQGDIAALVNYWREAVYLNPDSPVNNFNLGLGLMEDGQTDEGFYFVQEALRTYPEYASSQVFRETLLELKNKGRLPKDMEFYLEYVDEDES